MGGKINITSEWKAKEVIIKVGRRDRREKGTQHMKRKKKRMRGRRYEKDDER